MNCYQIPRKFFIHTRHNTHWEVTVGGMYIYMCKRGYKDCLTIKKFIYLFKCVIERGKSVRGKGLGAFQFASKNLQFIFYLFVNLFASLE